MTNINWIIISRFVWLHNSREIVSGLFHCEIVKPELIKVNQLFKNRYYKINITKTAIDVHA